MMHKTMTGNEASILVFHKKLYHRLQQLVLSIHLLANDENIVRGKPFISIMCVHPEKKLQTNNKQM